MAIINTLDSNGLSYAWLKIKEWANNLFVKKVDGKGLSTNDYTDAEKLKLAGLENYTLPTASASTKGGVLVGEGLEINENTGVLAVTNAGSADTVPWAGVTGKPETYPPSAHTHAISDIANLQSELDNKADDGDLTDLSDEINTALASKVDTSLLGQPNGVATLDSSGLIDVDIVPGALQEVVEGYALYDDESGLTTFYEDEEKTVEITGETNKIYVDITGRPIQYYWSGTTFIRFVENTVTAMTSAQIEEILSQ